MRVYAHLFRARDDKSSKAIDEANGLLIGLIGWQMGGNVHICLRAPGKPLKYQLGRVAEWFKYGLEMFVTTTPALSLVVPTRLNLQGFPTWLTGPHPSLSSPIPAWSGANLGANFPAWPTRSM